MTRTVDVDDAETHLSRLLEHVAGGEEVILAKAGRPVARIVTIDQPAARRAGFVAGEAGDEFFEPLPPEELSAWE